MNKIPDRWVVSRQCYWGVEDDPEDWQPPTWLTHVVEIARGGHDYMNPDCMKVVGDYDDPREAVEAAIVERFKWKKEKPEIRIGIGMGCTLGNTCPFECMTEEDLHKAAERAWERIPKCACCGGLRGEEAYGDRPRWTRLYGEEYECCSEGCAEKYYGMPGEFREEETDERR